MADPNEQKDAESEIGADLSTFDARNWKGRIREGKTRKGDVNDAPKTPRPNVRPKPQTPQKPTASSDNSEEGEDMADPDTLTIDLPPTVTKEDATFLLAVALYGADRISLGKAAEMAGISKRAFMERLVDEGVPVIDYDPEELEREMDA